VQRTYIMVSSTVFGLVALLQLARALGRWPMQIASMQVPVTASWVAFVLAGGLCLWGLRSAQRSRER
jgi:hypothetical protein